MWDPFVFLPWGLQILGGRVEEEMFETVEGLGGVARGDLREEGTSECWRVPEQFSGVSRCGIVFSPICVTWVSILLGPKEMCTMTCWAGRKGFLRW